MHVLLAGPGMDAADEVVERGAVDVGRDELGHHLRQRAYHRRHHALADLAVRAGGCRVLDVDDGALRGHHLDGSFRPVEVVAPERTIVNVKHPAPAGSHGEIRKRVVAAMIGALSQVVPELVSADIHRTSFHNLIGGIHPRTGKEYVHYEWASGGNGAFAEADGASAMATIDW